MEGSGRSRASRRGSGLGMAYGLGARVLGSDGLGISPGSPSSLLCAVASGITNQFCPLSKSDWGGICARCDHSTLPRTGPRPASPGLSERFRLLWWAVFLQNWGCIFCSRHLVKGSDCRERRHMKKVKTERNKVLLKGHSGKWTQGHLRHAAWENMRPAAPGVSTLFLPRKALPPLKILPEFVTADSPVYVC